MALHQDRICNHQQIALEKRSFREDSPQKCTDKVIKIKICTLKSKATKAEAVVSQIVW